MTYERPDILRETVKKLREQTFPPAYIVVIDNSKSQRTAEVVNELKGFDLDYHRVGHNSGPAGAAKRGLELLMSKGYDWIYWGDDDDPPENRFIFEIFFQKIKDAEENKPPVGVFGGRGGYFNKVTGRIKSLSNADLKKTKVVAVDTVPGGHSMLVKAEVVKQGVLPYEKLFFAFEDFDFCLKLKKAGYAALVDTEYWLKDNYRHGNFSENYRWKGTSFGSRESFWRDYYSTRNLLYIFLRERYFSAFAVHFFKTLIKAFFGFRFGWKYGRKNLQIQWLALIDFIMGRFGRRDSISGLR